MSSEQVIKWDQGRQTPFDAVPEDESYMRKMVMKDFIIYTIIYLFAPAGLFINKFADYPLKFNRSIPWIVFNTILSVSALLTLILPLLLPEHSYVTNIEKKGAAMAFILRCVLTACVEALNIEPNSIKSLHLERFPITPITESEEPLHAGHFYESIMSLSKFTTKLTAKNLFGRKIGIICGLIISTGLIVIPMILRKMNGHGLFGNGFLAFICISLSSIIIFGVSFFLINVFFIGFALYRSMRSSMMRLKNGTLGTWETLLEKDETLKESVPVIKRGKRNSSKNKPVLKLDVTKPQNLRAWLNVHEALNRRKEDVAARLLELGATLGMMFFMLMLFLIVLESFSTDYDKMSSEEFVADITELDKSSLYVFSYLVVVLGGCMAVLCLVGNEYNFSAKQMQIKHLYAIQLEATLDYYSGNDKLTDDETSELKNATKLLESVQQHLNNHVRDLGILGISYSKLFWGISGLISSVVTRQIFHLF